MLQKWRKVNMKDAKDALIGLLELFGLFLALAWPILLMFMWAADK